MEELYSFLQRMTKEEYEGYLARIAAFLKSPAVEKFTWDQFADRFYEAVAN